MLIEVKHLTKCIHKNTVLMDVNLTFESGKIYGIRGVNGSGKSMLMRAVCGLIHPTKGTVEIDGKVLGKDMEFPEDVGVLIENPGLIESYSGFKNLKTLADVKKVTTDEEIRELLRKLNLDPDDPKKVKKYSLGMKQKIGIAEAFLDNPKLLVLDEPLNALDEKTVAVVKKMIREYINGERIILVTCHDMATLYEVCDVVYKMEEGKIVAD